MGIESQGLSHVSYRDNSRVAIWVRLVMRVSDAIVDFILKRLECARFGLVANEHTQGFSMEKSFTRPFEMVVQRLPLCDLV